MEETLGVGRFLLKAGQGLIYQRWGMRKELDQAYGDDKSGLSGPKTGWGPSWKPS